MQALGAFYQLGRGFFLDGDDRHFNSLAARTFQHEKGKPAVPCDKSPTCRICAGIGHGVKEGGGLLLYDSARGGFDEADKFLNIIRGGEFCSHFRKSLRGI